MKKTISIISIVVSVMMILIALFTSGITYSTIPRMIMFVKSIFLLGWDSSELWRYLIILIACVVPLIGMLVGGILYLIKKSRGSYNVILISNIVGVILYGLRYIRRMGFNEPWQPSAFYIRFIRPFIIDTTASVFLVILIGILLLQMFILCKNIKCNGILALNMCTYGKR